MKGLLFLMDEASDKQRISPWEARSNPVSPPTPLLHLQLEAAAPDSKGSEQRVMVHWTLLDPGDRWMTKRRGPNSLSPAAVVENRGAAASSKAVRAPSWRETNCAHLCSHTAASQGLRCHVPCLDIQDRLPLAQIMVSGHNLPLRYGRRASANNCALREHGGGKEWGQRGLTSKRFHLAG